jgi:hypothetical protein
MPRPRTKPRDLFGHLLRPARRRSNVEDALQAAIVEFVRRCYPQVLIAAIPNGGWRTPAEAGRFRWTGVQAGMPDLVLTYGDRGILWLEVKDPQTGRLSDAQLEVIERLSAQGHLVAVVTSIDDARRELQALGLQSREAAS